MHWLSWLLFWRPWCVHRRVVVNLTHDSAEALEGVLWSTRGPWLTLRDVSGLHAGHPPAKMLGDVLIHRTQVAYLQVLPS